MSRKSESITISCSLKSKASLKHIAKDLGYTWGDDGNISQLIEAIASGEVEVSAPTDASRIKAKIKKLEAELSRAEKYPD